MAESVYGIRRDSDGFWLVLPGHTLWTRDPAWAFKCDSMTVATFAGERENIQEGWSVQPLPQEAA